MTAHYDTDNMMRVYAEIDLQAIMQNLRSIANAIGEKTKVLPVIKADGYGHGAGEIAKYLEQEPYVFGFGLATAEEAVQLRTEGISKPMLVLGHVFPYANEDMIANEIRFTVFQSNTIRQIDKTAAKIGKKAKVHIKVDTGMNRIGIKPDETGLHFIKELMSCKNIEIEGIYTHFSKADEPDKSYTDIQISTFLDFIHRIEKELALMIPIKHCCNSAGVIGFPQAHLDMVRPGIILYGMYPSDDVDKNVLSLRPALNLCSHITYIKKIQAGDAISYGGSYVAETEKMVATVPVGYGDGYPRELSNKGHVLIRGCKAPILGRICMDQLMVDVTHIEGVQPEDKVVLVGRMGEQSISVEDVSKISGRFNYEFICGLNKRIPRVYHA